MFSEDQSLARLIFERSALAPLRAASPAISSPLCQEQGAFLAFVRDVLSRANTRPAFVAPPLGHWYKDRAAIQATKNVQAIAG
jgi:hypothetical protein